MPLISVFMPAYNGERFIAQAIESVRAQTFHDWELIIVEDCSTDGTLAVCQQFVRQDSRIKLIRNDVNIGMMPNWNKGLGLCHAEYFAKLDCDDYWDEHMLEDCLQVLKNDPAVGLVVSRIGLVDENGILLHDHSGMPEYACNKTFSTVDLVKKGIHAMFRDQVLKQGIGLIRRSVFDELGFFLLHPAGDTEMWFRIGAHYRIAGLNKINYYYRIWSDSFSNREVAAQARHEQNIFETRELILDYYFKQQLLAQHQYTTFKKDNLLEFNKCRIARLRKAGEYAQAFRLFMSSFWMAPFRLSAFYFRRLIDKMT